MSTTAPSASTQPTQPTRHTHRVAGMSCQHCINAITAEIGQVDGVRRVTVDLDHDAVTVVSDHPLARDAVAAAIEEAGYTLS